MGSKHRTDQGYLCCDVELTGNPKRAESVLRWKPQRVETGTGRWHTWSEAHSQAADLNAEESGRPRKRVESRFANETRMIREANEEG